MFRFTKKLADYDTGKQITTVTYFFSPMAFTMYSVWIFHLCYTSLSVLFCVLTMFSMHMFCITKVCDVGCPLIPVLSYFILKHRFEPRQKPHTNLHSTRVSLIVHVPSITYVVMMLSYFLWVGNEVRFSLGHTFCFKHGIWVAIASMRRSAQLIKG